MRLARLLVLLACSRSASRPAAATTRRRAATRPPRRRRRRQAIRRRAIHRARRLRARSRRQSPKPDGGESPPEDELDADTTYRLVVETNCGSFTVTLDQELAPKTAASLVSLAENGFFDGTTFHRVVPGFVIQGGDPTGTGSGGPRLPDGRRAARATPAYTQGVVAMAKAGVRGAGHLREPVLRRHRRRRRPPARLRDRRRGDRRASTRSSRSIALGIADGPPSQPVVIERVSVSES